MMMESPQQHQGVATMTNDSGFSRDSVIARAKAIILTPQEEWPLIEAEQRSMSEIFLRYSMPIAAIGPVASFLGGQIFGYGMFGISYNPGLATGLSMAVMSYVMALAGIIILTLIVDFLAPRFNGTSDRLSAFKLVAYSMTAAALAGIFGIVPSLAWLGILGLYSLYLFYTGAAPMMKVPGEKAVVFTVVTFVCAIVFYLVTAAVLGAMGNMIGMRPGIPSAGEMSGTVNVPGVGAVDVGRMQAAAGEAEAAMKRKAVDIAVLQAMLPASIAGFSRSSIESTALGVGGSQAQGRYERDGQSFALSVTDMAALGAMASLGAAVGVQSNREDADGYERTRTIDGELVTEKWNRTRKSGEYGTTVASRFMVKAEGTADDIAVLKGAVDSIDSGKLRSLAD
jgi:hypothetical protein